MFAQQARHQFGHRQLGRWRQLPPLRPDLLVVEQTELDDLRQPSPRTAALAGHRRFPDSGGESPSVHQDQRQPLPVAFASVRSAASANSQALPGQPSANAPPGSTGKWLDRTSRPVTQANVPLPSHPHCSEICPTVPSRLPDERGPSGQTRDATDRELPDAPSHGRSVVVFYNLRRPHQSLGDRAPMAVWRAGVTGQIGGMAVDMTLRLDNATALPTYPQPQQQLRAA